MRLGWLWPVVLMVGALMGVGCAGGARYAAMTLPPPAQGQGRIVFYRDGNPTGMGLQPSIICNGMPVGRSQAGTFFYLDHPAGACEIVCLPDWSHKISVQVGAGETLYVRTYVIPGYVVGQVLPELVEAGKALADLPSCNYAAPPPPAAPSR